jgi:anthranilate synthase/aminodeoxychorismate synthase-like glutamine amidotransferase
MILVIDNYDSFTFNLVQYLGELGTDVLVFRNNQITPDQVAELRPKGIILSPGPCTPNESGVCLEVLRQFSATTPIFGVCLGHQCIGQYFGGKVIRAPQVMHGKTSEIFHSGDQLFDGIPSPFVATRYHSLIVERESLPDVLDVIGWTEDGIIMALRHKELPVVGVQFHPESILTAAGHRILANFLQSAGVESHLPVGR